MSKYFKLLLSLFPIVALMVLFVSCSLIETKGDPDSLVTPVNPGLAEYKEGCGQCHIPYPPHFLPTGSWDRILRSTKNHFGEQLDIDQNTKDIIISFLKESGAEYSDNKIAKKIIQSLDGEIPLRLTEVPYIRKKHQKYSPDVLAKKSIESLSQCNACHKSADKWKF